MDGWVQFNYDCELVIQSIYLNMSYFEKGKNSAQVATKADIEEFKFWFIKMLTGQAVILIGLMFAMLQFFLK